MKIFNFLQLYNEFCCYFKSTCSNFDKVIKLFTFSCLHPAMILSYILPFSTPPYFNNKAKYFFTTFHHSPPITILMKCLHLNNCHPPLNDLASIF